MRSPQVHLDDVLAGLIFAGLVRRQGAVGKNKPGKAPGRPGDDLLDPTEVGLAYMWDAKLPLLVFPDESAGPLLHVLRWIGQDGVGLNSNLSTGTGPYQV